MSRDIKRGELFAEELFELVRVRAPSDFSISEKDGLAAHLLSTAVSWVQARNRSRRGDGAQDASAKAGSGLNPKGGPA